MSYFTPYIGVGGLTIPTYAEILAELVQRKKEINEVDGGKLYLDSDSTDYQELSVFALMIYDSHQAVLLSYNNRSPVTAVGSGLDAVVKINGLARNSPSYSTAVVMVYGTPGTEIINGQASDTNGNLWNLPPSVVIPSGGQVASSVTADELGAIEASVGTITTIATPQYGWTSITNTAEATVGAPVETDSQLRERQNISTAFVATTPLESLMAAVWDIDGVTKAKGYENDTGSVDANGVPAHSICVVVQGGSTVDIAEAIYRKKTIGCGTYGSTTVTVSDYKDNPVDIDFDVATDIDIYGQITLTTTAKYTSSIGQKIVQAVVDYINALDIGEDVYLTKVVAAASLWGDSDNSTFVIDTVELGKTGDSPPYAASNIAIGFNEVAACANGSLANIVLVIT